MSVSFAMAAEVSERGGQCLCADLTVVPILAEWNKQFAARIAPLAGMNAGCIEINGDINYKNWDAMTGLLPDGMSFGKAENGRFALDNGYYDRDCPLFFENGYMDFFRQEGKRK